MMQCGSTSLNKYLCQSHSDAGTSLLFCAVIGKLILATLASVSAVVAGGCPQEDSPNLYNFGNIQHTGKIHYGWSYCVRGGA